MVGTAPLATPPSPFQHLGVPPQARVGSVGVCGSQLGRGRGRGDPEGRSHEADSSHPDARGGSIPLLCSEIPSILPLTQVSTGL